MTIETGASTLTLKIPWLGKLILVIVGVLLALVFSGDIDKEGRLKINLTVIIKAISGVAIGLTSSPFFIHYFEIQHYHESEQGFVYMLCSIFGLLVIGIVYRSIEMLKGKSFVEIIKEIKSAIKSITN